MASFCYLFPWPCLVKICSIRRLHRVCPVRVKYFSTRPVMCLLCTCALSCTMFCVTPIVCHLMFCSQGDSALSAHVYHLNAVCVVVFTLYVITALSASIPPCTCLSSIFSSHITCHCTSIPNNTLCCPTLLVCVFHLLCKCSFYDAAMLSNAPLLSNAFPVHCEVWCFLCCVFKFVLCCGIFFGL